MLQRVRGVLHQAQLPLKMRCIETQLVFVCPQCAISSPSRAFLQCIMCVVRNSWTDVIKIEVGDDSMRSVQRIRPIPPPTVHVSLVIYRALFMHWKMRLLKKSKLLDSLAEYGRSFFIRIKQNVMKIKFALQPVPAVSARAIHTFEVFCTVLPINVTFKFKRKYFGSFF